MSAKLAICIMLIAIVPVPVYANMLTFDDVPSGTLLYALAYSPDHYAIFFQDFQATDHTGSAWGYPHSPPNVLTSLGGTDSRILFGHGPGPPWIGDPVQSVGAYFSTDAGATIRITAFHQDPYGPLVPVTSVTIGGVGESWDNRYLAISTTPNLPFELLKFEGVNSADDLLGFCADDMTITLVPEPSSLLALGGGSMGLAGLAVRRRRR